MSKFSCYTDGACSLARNKGGIGIVVVKDGEKVYEFKKSFTDTTNNKCELMAVIYALNAISKPIEQMTLDGQVVARYYNEYEAVRQSNGEFTVSCINSVALGKRKSYKGYRWRYVDN